MAKLGSGRQPRIIEFESVIVPRSSGPLINGGELWSWKTDRQLVGVRTPGGTGLEWATPMAVSSYFAPPAIREQPEARPRMISGLMITATSASELLLQARCSRLQATQRPRFSRSQ